MTSSMKNILIIGGTSGIGEAFACQFHSLSKNVIITGRREQRLAAIKQSLPGIETYAFDMTGFAAIPSHVDALFKQFPSIDTVWVNGGVQDMSDIKDVSSTTDAKLIDEINTNITAPLVLARHVIPRLIAQNHQTTFMITSSGLGFLPVGSLFPVYGPTKAAIHHYMVGIRQALKDTNVNVIELVPPYVDGTELVTAEKADMVKHAQPMPKEDFVRDIFAVLESSDGKDLKEVTAGTAIDRVKAWRSSYDPLLAASFGG